MRKKAADLFFEVKRLDGIIQEHMGLEHCTANIQIKHFIRPEKLSEKQENLCQVILSS